LEKFAEALDKTQKTHERAANELRQKAEALKQQTSELDAANNVRGKYVGQIAYNDTKYSYTRGDQLRLSSLFYGESEQDVIREVSKFCETAPYCASANTSGIDGWLPGIFKTEEVVSLISITCKADEDFVGGAYVTFIYGGEPSKTQDDEIAGSIQASLRNMNEGGYSDPICELNEVWDVRSGQRIVDKNYADLVEEESRKKDEAYQKWRNSLPAEEKAAIHEAFEQARKEYDGTESPPGDAASASEVSAISGRGKYAALANCGNIIGGVYYDDNRQAAHLKAKDWQAKNTECDFKPAVAEVGKDKLFVVVVCVQPNEDKPAAVIVTKEDEDEGRDYGLKAGIKMFSDEGYSTARCFNASVFGVASGKRLRN
jgi:hypothetical protein